MNKSAVLLEVHSRDTTHTATVTQHAHASLFANPACPLRTTTCIYGTAKNMIYMQHMKETGSIDMQHIHKL